MIFRRLPAVDLEISEAAEWYENQRPQPGDEFLGEVEQAFDRIRHDPLLYERVERFTGDDVRRCLLHRFPHLVIYRYKAEEILVVPVSHVRRKPFYWLERIS